MVIGRTPEAEGRYRECHAVVWPKVLDQIKDDQSRNGYLFLKDGRLFSYFEYQGGDFAADRAKTSADSTVRGWWSILEPMQELRATRGPNGWRAEMREVFHME